MAPSPRPTAARATVLSDHASPSRAVAASSGRGTTRYAGRRAPARTSLPRGMQHSKTSSERCAATGTTAYPPFCLEERKQNARLSHDREADTLWQVVGDTHGWAVDYRPTSRTPGSPSSAPPAPPNAGKNVHQLHRDQGGAAPRLQGAVRLTAYYLLLTTYDLLLTIAPSRCGINPHPKLRPQPQP